MSAKTYLLDTNICVFLLRGKYDIDSRISAAGIENCYISEITVAELLYGAECSNRPADNKRMVKDFCNKMQIIPINEALEEYAHQKNQLRRSGTLIDDLDLLIGSTAAKYGFVMVTDNTKHFERLARVVCENWVER